MQGPSRVYGMAPQERNETMNHADIDYCGIVQLLDWLLAYGALEEQEYKNMRNMLRKQMGARILLIANAKK